MSCMKTTTDCPMCGTTFTRYHTAQLTPKFCSRKCANNDRAGKVSAETRAKLSAANRAERNNNWRGGTRTRSIDGRVFIRVPDDERHLHPTLHHDGYVLRYHYVWNLANPGNPVQKGEAIHHINHDPTDDRIENLEKTVQSEHARNHGYEQVQTAETLAKKSASLKRYYRVNVHPGAGKKMSEKSLKNMREAQQARRARERGSA